MRTSQRLSALATAGILLLAPTACGDDDKKDESISKKSFVDKANAICEKGSDDLEALGEKLGDQPTEEQIESFLDKAVENIEGQMKDIRALGFPKDDEDELDELFDEADKVISEIKKDPMAAEDTAFEGVNEKMTDYGLTKCADD